MEYRNIPGTKLNVSMLAYGNFIFGTNWWGEFTDSEGIRLQNKAFDLGVNFFDSAAAYGNGRAERLLAQTIKYAGRDNLVISTKFGYDFYFDPGEQGGHRERRQDFTPAFLRYDLEKSLERLEIDCIDLYQAHNLKLTQFRDDIPETMEKFVKEGKIRYWGVALGPAIGWREEGYKSFNNWDAAVVQTVFNMYEQDPGREFCEIAQARGKGGVIARVPTNSGILDDEFKTPSYKFPDWDHRKFRDRNWLIYGIQKNNVIRPMADALGLSLRQFALKWFTSFPSLVSVEPNITNDAELEDCVKAFDGKTLPQSMVKQIEHLYSVDFYMGEGAHPCNWKSSITPDGVIRSGYQPVR